jgi:hypothetical protein
MLRGKATQAGATNAAVKVDSARSQAFAPRVGTANKTGGNTFSGVPTVAVKRVMVQGARQ